MGVVGGYAYLLPYLLEVIRRPCETADQTNKNVVGALGWPIKRFAIIQALLDTAKKFAIIKALIDSAKKCARGGTQAKTYYACTRSQTT